MDANKVSNQKETGNRKTGISTRKLSDEERRTFLMVLSSIMSGVPCPKDARLRYLKEVENRLRNNGADFLSKSRAFPTYGLKLLGGDTTGFPIKGFKRAENKIYPRLFAWYWAELQRLSMKEKPTTHDVRRAQRVLCVLSFAKMIKTSSVNQIKKSLIDFEKRVTSQEASGLDVESDDKPNEIKLGPIDALVQDGDSVPSLKETLGFDVDLETLPGYVDFNSYSAKPSALKRQIKLPPWIGLQFIQVGQNDVGHTAFDYCCSPPYGKVHVLVEAAGKLRLILPYNTPFVHSTGLFARCRAILDCLKQDASKDQTRGHVFVRKLTAAADVAADDYIISADLDAFSDNTSTAAIRFCLSSIGLPRLEGYLTNLPVLMPNGTTIVPKKLLMGLKGCFELSCVLHHYAVKLAGIDRYTLCGDDLAYYGQISSYESSINAFGWSLNRSKTVISKTAAVFCGEMYWFGHRVSPKVPKVHSMYANGKLRRAAVLFSVTRDTIKSLETIYTRKRVANIVSTMLHLLKRKWKGIILPSLPSKLRGLGMKPIDRCSLLDRMEHSKGTLRVCLMSIGIESELVAHNRWFGLPIEIAPSKAKPLLPAFPALVEGGVSLRVPVKRPSYNKLVTSLDLYQALEWYYYDQRLPKHCFGIDDGYQRY